MDLIVRVGHTLGSVALVVAGVFLALFAIFLWIVRALARAEDGE
ncbi:hypothetical protein [Streptomyces sp. RFCAC02]|nr:hypothetical protein [Streptomyces sp. RFCAC02]